MMSQNEQSKNKAQGPHKSVEGWIIIAVGLHEESLQDDIYDAFSEYGQIKSLHFNMDRKSGFAKGYALIEYQKFEQAEAAIKTMDGNQIYDKKIKVDWAFMERPLKQKQKEKRRNK